MRRGERAGRDGGWDCRHFSPRERAAARELVRRVRVGVPAELARAFLFGSKARGEGRPDSDVDVLLVFRRLPPDREPQAGIAEGIAEEVAADTGVPVTVWSVALVDLEHGNRTPMLVDALDDGIPLWPPGAPPVRVAFTPDDALRCVDALLARVQEGSEEATESLARGDVEAAARRMRDDVVRLCTATLLLEGVTRPRRAQAARVLERRCGHRLPLRLRPLLRWAAESYGPEGKDEERPVAPPPGGLREGSAGMGFLRRSVVRRAAALERSRAAPGTPGRAGR